MVEKTHEHMRGLVEAMGPDYHYVEGPRGGKYNIPKVGHIESKWTTVRISKRLLAMYRNVGTKGRDTDEDIFRKVFNKAFGGV
jgi:hypothetical protein